MIRVLVVDDDPLVRAAVRLLLGVAAEIEVVGEAADGAQAVTEVARLDPDVVLMDIRMPGHDGLSATEQLRRRGSRPAVLVLTTFETDELVLQALRAGADGYLVKDATPEALVGAVRQVSRGEPIVSATVLSRLIDMVVDESRAADEDRARAALDSLNDQERKVALAVGQGKSNADIGLEHFLSTSTVKGYLTRIMTKTGCENRVQVALLVHRARGIEGCHGDD